MIYEANLDFFHYPQNILSYNIVKRDPIWKKCHIGFMRGVETWL